MPDNTKTWIIVLGLILLAAFPRFWQLGQPGFYGDEETSALAARSLAQGDTVRMPSGMPYPRALPQTFLNAASARLFGLDEEASYRLPAAIFGVITVPIMFLLARSWVGTPAALVTAVLLALSEWHIATSREARMYAPFLMFYLITLFTIWHWSIHGGWRYLATGTVSFFAAVSFHILGTTAAVLILLPLLSGDWASRRSTPLLGVAITFGGLGGLYYKWNNAPLVAWNVAYAQGTAVTEHFSAVNAYVSLYSHVLDIADPLMIASLAAGALIGLLIARQAATGDEGRGGYWRLFAHYAAAATAGAFTAGGRLHGAALMWCLFLAFYPRGLAAVFRAGRAWWAALAVLALVNVVWTIAQTGVAEGTKKLLMFPFPYAAWFLQMLGAVFVLFALAVLHAVIRPADEKDGRRRILVMAAVLSLLGIGLISQWGGMRYLIGAYPFILLLAATALSAILERVGRRFSWWGARGALVVGLALALTGVLGGHGLPQAVRAATVKHGDKVGSLEYDIVVYPDHETPGRFVAQHRQPHDLVMAEDALEQTWYAGRVDYALRDPEYYRAFLYRAADGKLRDIYVNSLSLDDGEFRRLQGERSQRIWVITSGEIQHARARHLSPAQHAWLMDVETTLAPAFVGRDGLTKVYCLNCDKGNQPND